MANPIKERSLEPHIAELVKVGFNPRGAFVTLIQDLATRSDKTQTNLGEIQAKANVKGRTEQIGVTVQGLSNTGDINATTKVVGRTEGIGTTVGQLTSAGQLVSTDQIAADGTGSPLAGGKRGFQAINSGNRLATSFNGVPVSTTMAPTSATTLSNDGVFHTINLASFINNYGAGAVAYNSASLDPGSFNTWFIFTQDPTFSGGATTPFASLLASDQTLSDSNIPLGKIITVNGSAKTGGGTTGGTTPGGAGGRGYIQ